MINNRNIKPKKHLLCLTLSLLFALSCHSQSFITLDGSQVSSNFKYTNSSGQQDNSYSNNITGGYSLGYRIYKRSIFFRLNVGMRKAGANLTDDNNTIIWTLQYSDLRLGIGYELNKWRLKPYLSASFYGAYLLKANQNINGKIYDLKSTDSFETTDLGVFIIPGAKFYISDYISIYGEFSYLIGLKNIETEVNQKLYNKGFLLSLGIAATLTKSRPKWLQKRR